MRHPLIREVSNCGKTEEAGRSTCRFAGLDGHLQLVLGLLHAGALRYPAGGDKRDVRPGEKFVYGLVVQFRTEVKAYLRHLHHPALEQIENLLKALVLYAGTNHMLAISK